ncbi:MAG: hypothetical protein EZS28_034842 [Streblomastix strix]|uniref:Uncharacterized protein n=1 Tax=Streblomastix strix TaxID=222440 RepID=A0A5J4UHR7_9EUKA|nr:MAG: hypothetical protein EZS28_034842 [Streblomastix strix]
MEQDTIKMYLRMQEEKERMQEEKEKQQKEIALLKQQLAIQHPLTQPINIEPKQQSISTQPKVTSEPKIMIEPPVTQATVTQVRNVLTPVESKVIQDIEVNGDTYKHTEENRNYCTLLFNPVINKGIVKFEVLRVKSLSGVGIADESVRYGRSENPSARGEDKIVHYDNCGGIKHIGDRIGGNSGFWDAFLIGMEAQQPNFIINIPKAVRIFTKSQSFPAGWSIENSLEKMIVTALERENGQDVRKEIENSIDQRSTEIATIY